MKYCHSIVNVIILEHTWLYFGELVTEQQGRTYSLMFLRNELAQSAYLV